MEDLGNIKIYFGKVNSVTDDKKLNRCKVVIDGYTEGIDEVDLAWYFPWYGLNYLPLVNDIVPVIIFDDNFSSGFYGRKVDLDLNHMDDTDYENYLEIFKRTIDDKDVQLLYTLTDGIIFSNGNSKSNITIDDITHMVNGWGIKVTKDRIDLGKDGEASLLGDKSVASLHEIVAHQQAQLEDIMKIFTQVASVSTTPFTAPQGAMITSLIPTIQPKLTTENKKIDKKLDTIQSKKTFIE